ncbi:ABC transporter substrate-binding protein [Galbibacter pacificus]|uniref:Helical backbone metal receptor n=1 Tax=Galbibacter pacificus TaxID=2996052 RepID=A0ABT6FWN7_9FLAO|nr:helical backbone metal receptor [Galbibacter pacificus]MDG3584192.1 helical backbone metal receptor [Galbibacter pacificus]MDG3587674.1 helical backbone metal receptor [Galbibacter pacificus]
MFRLIDQTGRHINIPETSARIVSLVPSQTELLCDLGLETQLVGVTKFCVHPSSIKDKKQIVGGTKNIKLDVIRSLQPDIVLCNKEENTKEIVQSLEQFTTVHVSDIFTFEDALSLINQYGVLFKVEDKASVLIRDLEEKKADFELFIQNKPLRNVAYFIWKKPWMVAGGNTFINHLLKLNNFKNVFAAYARYPEIELAQLKSKGTAYILLSSEPYPFKEKHMAEIQKQIPKGKVILVDGEYFSWYGSRLQKAFSYFKELHEKL